MKKRCTPLARDLDIYLRNEVHMAMGLVSDLFLIILVGSHMVGSKPIYI